MILNLIKLASALILALYLRQLVSSFSFMGINELRRRAAAGQEEAKKVLEARVHGIKLYLLLWFLFGLTIVTAVIALDDLLPETWWVSAGLSAFILICLTFVLPWIRAWSPKLGLAAQVAPKLDFFFNKIQKVSQIFSPLRLSQKIQSDSLPAVHSKEHLLEILESLRSQTEHPRVLADLELASLTLTFSSKKIKSLMMPIGEMRKVFAQQDITPKLADELNSSGFIIFPVRRAEGDDGYCGILYIRDVKRLSRTNRSIRQTMRPCAGYLHLDSPLSQVVDAFIKTQEQLFFVINDSARIVGLISLSDVLEQFVGERQLGKFQHYDDPQMVVHHFGQQSSSEKTADAAGRGTIKTGRKTRLRRSRKRPR